jgi:Xaa-Pro aminopeptidase
MATTTKARGRKKKAKAQAKRPATATRLPTPPRSEAPYAKRLDKLAAMVEQSAADHLLVTSERDVGYLTGFLGGHSYLLVGPRGKRPVVISDFRYQEELEPTRSIADVHIRTVGLIDAVEQVAQERGVKRCAVQGEHLPVSEFQQLTDKLRGIKVVATSGLVGKLRIRKDEHEIALIRHAVRIQEAALLALLPTLAPGQTELEVAARLEAEMKSRGSSEVGFQTIIAARANGSLPHYRPGREKLAAGKPLLIDWGAVYRGYHGDMTRTFALGKWPAKIREIYQIVRDAQQLAAEALAPGKSTHEIDGIARDYITRHGYGEQFGHGLGHGMGMDGHEDPRLNQMFAPSILEPGHVVTVEPGIYLPGIGGVRIEDDYVVTERGAENLCRLPKDIDWATL